jgi:hypothetical protein
VEKKNNKTKETRVKNKMGLILQSLRGHNKGLLYLYQEHFGSLWLMDRHEGHISETPEVE